MSSGTLSITLTVPGVPDPIYKQQLEFDCSDIAPHVKGVCPFKVGGTSVNWYKWLTILEFVKRKIKENSVKIFHCHI